MAGLNLPPELQAIFNQTSGNASKAGSEGTSLFSSGSASLAPIMAYFSKLAGGDPATVAAATAPQRRRVIDQYDTARKTISQFGPRGGGTNAALAGSQTSEANELADVGANAQAQAANTGATIATQEQGLGLSAEQIQNSDLNSIISAIMGQQGINLQNKQINSSIFSGLGQLAGTLLTSAPFLAAI